MKKREYAEFLIWYTEKLRAAQLPSWEQQKQAFLQEYNVWGISWPGHLAHMEAALYLATKEEKYLIQVKEITLLLCDLQEELAAQTPKDPYRVEIMECMFSFTPLMMALRAVGKQAFTAAEWTRVERLCYAEVCNIFFDCEWGRHNRCTLRAIALLVFGQLFPEHQDSTRALELSHRLMADSLGSWSIEDATSYLGLWVTCLTEYTQYTGVWNFRIEQILSYYSHYFASMLLPSGGLPEFGDSRFDSATSSALTYSAMELIASRHKDGFLKYAIERQFRNMVENSTMDNDSQFSRGIADALAFADDSVEPQPPNVASCEVLEELVGKKIVFRSGWDKNSTYLFYNYRDVGPFGKLTRDYLQNTIPVHAEKPHHGHADEQSINALCTNGRVFLRDGGYRDCFTPNGHYRADFYHNRLVARNGRMFREKGFLEYAENIGDYLPVETEKIYFQQFSFAECAKTHMTDRFHKIKADRHIFYLTDEDIFIVADTVASLEDQELTTGVMFHGETVEEAAPGVYRILEDSFESLTHFCNEKPEKVERITNSLCIGFAAPGGRFSVEEQRRNYRQEKALSHYTSRYFAAGECFSYVSVLIPETGETPQQVLQSRKRAADFLKTLKVTQDFMGKHLTIELTCGQKNYLFGIQCDDTQRIADRNHRPTYTYEAGKAAYGSFETDAKLVVSNGVRYGFVEAIGVSHNGEPLFRTRTNACLQLDFKEALHLETSWGSFEGELSTKDPQEKGMD